MLLDKLFTWLCLGKVIKRKKTQMAEPGQNSSEFESYPPKYAARSHVLKIETTNICNAKCSFCAYQYTNRDKINMSPEVFAKVIRDYVAIGGGSVGFTPVVGEFLLDPYIFDRLEAALNEPKITDIGFHTNLLNLTKYADDEIMKIMISVDWLSISVGPNAEAYKASFGVDRFNDLLEGLECLVKFKTGGVSMPLIKIEGRAASKNPEIDERLKSCVDILLNGREVGWMTEYSDWGGEINDLTTETQINRVNRFGKPSSPCMLPLLSSVVFSNGDVGLCACADAHASLVVGNIMQDSLCDILSSCKRNELISGFMTGKLKPCCSACTFYQPLNSRKIDDWVEWINPHHFVGLDPIWTRENGQLIKRKR